MNQPQCSAYPSARGRASYRCPIVAAAPSPRPVKPAMPRCPWSPASWLLLPFANRPHAKKRTLHPQKGEGYPQTTSYLCLMSNGVQIFCFLFPSSSLGTQLCRSSSFGEPFPKPEVGNEGEAGASRAGRSQAGAWERGEMELMRLLLQGHLDLPQRVTLDVVLKDLHPV